MLESLAIGLMVTQHIDHCRNCNELHPTITITMEDPWEHVDFAAGAYYNSYRGVTGFVGARFEYGVAFAETGLATGYQKQIGHPVIPFGRVGLTFGNVDVFAFPSTDGENIRLGVGVGVNLMEWGGD